MLELGLAWLNGILRIQDRRRFQAAWVSLPCLLPMITYGRLASLSQPQLPALQVQKGAQRLRSIDVVLDLSTSEHRISMKQSGETHAFPNTPALHLRRAVHEVFYDRYEAVSSSSPTKILRTIEKATQSLSMSAVGSAPEDGQSFDRVPSQLEGRQLLFVWDSDKNRFSCNADGFDLGANCPSIFSARADLAGALPVDNESLNRGWMVGAGYASSLLFPGGDMFPTAKVTSRPPADSKSADVKLESALVSLFGPILLENAKGRMSAHYSGSEIQDGRQVAKIDIHIEITTHPDVYGEMRPRIERCLPAGKRYEYSHSLTCEFRGDGVLLWDISSGVERSFNAAVEAKVAESITLNTDARNQAGELVPVDLLWSASWGGQLQITMACETPK